MSTVEKKDGRVTVNIQQPDFTRAIAAIAESNLMLAKALSAVPHITIQDCVINGAKTGVSVESFDQSRHEAVEKVENDA